jgi:hypothetical protein
MTSWSDLFERAASYEVSGAKVLDALDQHRGDDA